MKIKMTNITLVNVTKSTRRRLAQFKLDNDIRSYEDAIVKLLDLHYKTTS